MAARLGRSLAAIDMLYMRGTELVRRVAIIRLKGLDLIRSWESDLECTR